LENKNIFPKIGAAELPFVRNDYINHGIDAKCKITYGS
jgi:hypothetical protein